jgi:ParB family chromosome partitioning protein
MHPIPIPEIDPTALLRDRSDLDPAALATLRTSIAAEGLRMPIEVWTLSTPRIQPNGPPHRYGLISGLRRLTACRSLGHTTIPAFLRTPDTLTDAMAAMISENEHRSAISAWEKGRILLYAQ